MRWKYLEVPRCIQERIKGTFLDVRGRNLAKCKTCKQEKGVFTSHAFNFSTDKTSEKNHHFSKLFIIDRTQLGENELGYLWKPWYFEVRTIYAQKCSFRAGQGRNQPFESEIRINKILGTAFFIDKVSIFVAEGKRVRGRISLFSGKKN